MNSKQRACAVAAFLLLAAVAFGQQQSTQNPLPPKSSGKATAPKPIPCSQRLKAETDSNAKLVNALMLFQNANNDLVAKQQEAADKIAQLLKEKADLLEKQANLIERQQKSLNNEHDLGLNQGMLLNDVSGTWKIQNGNSGTGGVCSVRVSYESRTIVLSNCRY